MRLSGVAMSGSIQSGQYPAIPGLPLDKTGVTESHLRGPGLMEAKDLGTAEALKITLCPHASPLYRIVAEP